MEKPRSHHGVFLPDKKNSELLFPDFLETTIRIVITAKKKTRIIPSSKAVNVIIALSSAYSTYVKSNLIYFRLKLEFIFCKIEKVESNFGNNINSCQIYFLYPVFEN